jgi:hypothetical protein
MSEEGKDFMDRVEHRNRIMVSRTGQQTTLLDRSRMAARHAAEELSGWAIC